MLERRAYLKEEFVIFNRKAQELKEIGSPIPPALQEQLTGSSIGYNEIEQELQLLEDFDKDNEEP